MFKEVRFFGLVVFVVVLLGVFVLALPQEQITKEYDSATQTVTLRDSADREIASIQLLSELHRVIYGNDDYVAEIKITTPVDYKNFISNMEFYENNENGKSIVGSFSYKYYNPIGTSEEIVYEYEEQCEIAVNGTEICSNELIGSHKETIVGTWEDFNPATIPSGETKIRMYWDDELDPGQTIEWIPTFKEVRVDEWTTFTGATRYDYSTATDADTSGASPSNRLASTFTIGVGDSTGDMSPQGVALYISNGSALSGFEVALWTTTGGLPTNDYNGQLVTNKTVRFMPNSQDWVNITLPSNVTLVNGTEYAIVLTVTTSGTVSWRSGYTATLNKYYTDYPTPDTWNAFSQSARTFAYEVWGTEVDATPPETTVPIINSTDNTNKSNQDLHCYANLTDVEKTTLTAYWTWFNDTVTHISGSTQVTAGTLNEITTLAAGNITKGDNWKCQVEPYDGVNYGTPQNSTSLLVVNSVPTHSNPTLTTPTGQNFSTQDLTCGNVSTSDADGDSVTNVYNWYKGGQSLAVLNLPLESNANDYSGSDNDGTITGASSVTGKVGKGLSFDGDDDVTILDSGSLDFTNEKSWELWFKRDGTGAETLFNKGNTTQTNYKLEFLGDDRLKFSYSLTPGWTNYLWEVINQADFDKGTYIQTHYNVTNNAVMLSDVYDGNYTSKVFNNSEQTLSFDTLSWNADVPTVEELSVEGGMEFLAHLDEQSGTIVDSTGQGSNGTQSGGVTYDADGKISTALSFDGSDDYVSFGNRLGFERTDTFSIGTWIKTSEGAVGMAGKLEGSSPYTGWFFQLNGVGKPTLILSNTWGSNWLVGTADFAVNDDSWHHVLATYDGSSDKVGVKIYVDGDSKDITGDPSTLSASILNSKNFQVSGYDGTNTLFEGSIDEMVIYNTNLTESKVQEIYDKGAGAITNLSLSVRSCDDNACSGESWTGISESSPQDISSLVDNKFFQFKAHLETNNTSYSPKLYNVTLNYSASVIGEDASISSTTAITDSNWHLATVTYDTNNNLSLYIDNSVEASETETSLPQYLSNDLIIGDGFNGDLDEFRIYGDALSPEQIANNFNLGYDTIVSQETSGGEDWMCQVTPNDAENDGVTLDSANLSVFWEITFNVTDSFDTTTSLNGVTISCNYSEFDQAGDTTNAYGPYGFPDRNWKCEFSKDNYFDKTKIFVADADKTIDIGMSERRELTVEEHTWLEAIYDCINGGDCALYNTLLQVNDTIGKIWEHTAPTDETVVNNEDITNWVVDSENNLTIDYSVYVPIKAGYAEGAYLPIRIGFWFLNPENTTCYNQGYKPAGVEDPYCQPLITELIGPMGENVSFTVELSPSLPVGGYSVKRTIDIDPLGVWYNYGQEVIGTFAVTEALSDYGISTEIIEGSDDDDSSSSSSSSSDSSSEVITTADSAEEDNEIIRLNDKAGITGAIIGESALAGWQFVIVTGILAAILMTFIICNTLVGTKKK